MAAHGPTIRVVSAEIHHDGRYLLTQRSARAVLPLLWEFPGGRVRDGENDRDALSRAVRHRIGVDVDVGDRVLEVRHAYPEYSVVLAVYRCAIGSGEPFAQAVHAVAWVAPDEFADYPFPDADQRTVELLLKEG
ncbi:MAG: (deoxy)nucleoside triphosphate pyrophosphohydrolase [Myxococcota bacterium]